MDIFLGVIVGLIVLIALVTLHEFGHFIAARRNGVKVLEFGICFPPRAIAWVKDPKTKKWRRLKKKDWKKPQEGLIFSLNWLPIGGFCQMDGESDADTRKGTFGAASFWSKTKILFAGVAMNWLIAIVIFTILAWTGMPEFLDGQFTVAADTRVETAPIEVVEVIEGSPADLAGFKSGDKILKIDGQEFYTTTELNDYNREHAGEEVTYLLQREVAACEVTENCSVAEECEENCETETVEESFETTATLNSADAEYLLGISMSASQSISYSTWSAPIVGVGITAQLTGETFRGVGIMIGNLVSGVFSQFSTDSAVRESGQEAISAVGDSVTGPVGIIGQLFPAFTAAGPSNLAFLSALISVSLACMNVLPIPALDGGRWFLIALYKVRRKKLTKEIEEKIVARAMMVLLALIFIVTILDIIRIAE